MGENTENPAGNTPEDSDAADENSTSTEKSKTKKIGMFLAKLVFAVGAYWLIYRAIAGRDGVEDLEGHIANLQWGWVGASIGMLLIAMSFAIIRWRALLHGQGIRPTWGFLVGSLMIARFWGAFTPGGFTGFGGWRIFDVATRTSKIARATATIGVEILMGQVAFGLVVMGASIYGVRFIGTDGVLMVNLFFGSVVVAALILMSKPALFRWVAKFLPRSVRTKVHTLVDAVCAYQGKGKTLVTAVLAGVGVHAFNNLIYVCAARALGVELGVGEVFFASSLQIFATLIPASINGMGLRETAAIALYTSPAIGLPLAQAVLIPVVGFCAEMFVSSFGGLIFLARRSGYNPPFEIDDIEHEASVLSKHEDIPKKDQPSPKRGLIIGLGAGLLAGMIVGIGEASVIVYSGNGTASLSVLSYGAVAYGLLCMLLGGGFGLALAISGRSATLNLPFFKDPIPWSGRRKMDESRVYGNIAAFFVSLFGLALGAFRIRRDVFHEELVWKSGQGIALLLGCLIVSVGVFFILSTVIRSVLKVAPSKKMRGAGTPIFVAIVIGALYAVGASASTETPSTSTSGARPDVPEGAGNVLFIVVDTLRADHLPVYGYENGSTPNLDAFADDAIRFDMAFANASWTRPSFASIMTGRYPSNHGVMAKSDALPDELTTIGEAFRDGGYQTGGLVTNFNVGPYYNFHQGFDEYRFLEPNFVLGADDSAAKLLLVQFLRQRIEKWHASRGEVEPGGTYQDAGVVNEELLSWIDTHANNERPFFSFVGYMDPHDPYYEHPYNGLGYSRAAHQSPEPEEAEHLRELYNGEITFWDEHFGELIEALKERGLYDDLTIVITADHGEEFCEHGGFWHGTTLYDEQIRVPLFVKLPAARRGGTTVRHWVQSIDIMPSLLRLENVQVPAGIQGGDIFNGTDVVYAEESHEGNVLESVRQRSGTDERKIIFANAGNPRGLETTELYRVDFDLGEEQNLAAEHEATVDRLETVRESMQRIAQRGGLSADTVELNATQREQGCALGYDSREACCEHGLSQYCDE